MLTTGPVRQRGGAGCRLPGAASQQATSRWSPARRRGGCRGRRAGGSDGRRLPTAAAQGESATRAEGQQAQGQREGRLGTRERELTRGLGGGQRVGVVVVRDRNEGLHRGSRLVLDRLL